MITVVATYVSSQMDFTHYTNDPVNLAVDLINTLGTVSGTDSLDDDESLARFLRERSGIWQTDLPGVSPGDLSGVKHLRAELRSVFEAEDAHTAADRINAILRDSGASPFLSTHGKSPHLHFEPEGGSLTEWLGVITAMGLATAIADHGFDRLGSCESDTCADVYIDASRNRSRRHCSPTCRTRENVAAHRQRKRTEG